MTTIIALCKRTTLLASPLLAFTLIMGCAGKDEAESTNKTASAQSTQLTDNSIYHLASEWRDQRGEKVTLPELAGKPRVATMFYSTCDFACPKTIEDMKKIIAALPEDEREQVGMTLFSFDPARDTPARLDTVANDMGLTDGWMLLTSTDAAAEELGAATEIQYKDLETGEFSHSNTILILNSSGEIVHRQEGVGSDPARSIEVLKRLLAQ